jgi:hypothetical protein
MPELTKDQAWKLSANAEYQKVVAVIMNLATGILFLPILFLKDFVKLPEGEPPWRIIWPWALLSWIALVLSLMWGMWFYRSSAKFVKVVYGGLESYDASYFEGWRDRSIALMVGSFVLGFVFLIVFFVTYAPRGG